MRFNMKTFFQWLEDNNLELPVVQEVPEGEETTKENTKRTGYSFNYPDPYVRSQYPHKYFNPIKATADLDAENKPKRVPDSAAN